MSRFALLFAVCFAFLFVARLQAVDAPPFIELQGGTGKIYSVAFSPDGKKIVTGESSVAQTSTSNTARIYDVESGEELLKLTGHTDGIRCVAFSPDGTRVATGSGMRDSTIRIWDANTGKELQRLVGHTYEVNSVAFSPDGKTIITGGGTSTRPRVDYDHTVRIWDADSGKELKKLEGFHSRIQSVVFSPDGTKFVIATDTTAQIWDVESGVEMKKLQLPVRTIGGKASAAFSSDGKKIVVSSTYRGVHVFDSDSGKELIKLDEEHTQEIQSASFSPDRKRIVTASFDNTVRIWDAESGKELQRWEHPVRTSPYQLYFAVFSPCGKKVASSNLTTRIWKLE